MASDRIEFGSVLDKGGDSKVWLVIVPAILLVLGIGGYGMLQMSNAGTVKRDLERSRAEAAELQKTVEERDKLLVAARAEESLQRSPGAAVAMFYGVNPRAQASGVVFAHPADKAARVYLYGLGATEGAQEYVVAARTADGASKPLGTIVPGNDGTGFLLAQDVPEGTTAIELLVRPQGQDGLEGAEPRISARFSTGEQRGVLTDAPAVQARRGAR
jgi:hypothetical protein